MYWLVGWTTENTENKKIVACSLKQKSITDKADECVKADDSFRFTIVYYGNGASMWFTVEKDEDGWYKQPIGWDTRAVTKAKEQLINLVVEAERNPEKPIPVVQ